MKKIIFSLSALAALLLAGSCQRENLEPVEQGGTVTYTVQVPGALATKTDGADFVAYYEVYRQGDVETPDALPVYEGSQPFENGSANIELEFVKNQKFVVLFWAQKEGLTAYNTGNLRNVTLNSDLTANQENYEVFAGNDLVENCASKKGGNVVLVRPIAQLNIATDAEGLHLGTTPVELKKSYVKVTGLSATYNVYEGYGSTETANAVYGMADVPTGTVTVGTKPYTYVAMNYIGFMPQSDITVDVDFTIQTSEGNINHTVSNVPVKANYKTNIIGNLITATDNYQVTLGDWGTPDTNVEVVAVSTAQDLQEAIDNIKIDGAEGNIILEGDIDLSALAGMISTKAAVPTYGLQIPAGKAVVIDLNGKILSQTVNQTGAYSMIQNSGNLTIVDSKGTGKIAYGDTGNGGNYVSNTIGNSGTLVIESGLIENNSSATVAANGYPHPIDNSGELTINGGTITNNAHYSSMRIWCTTDDDTSVTINGGTFNGSIDFQTVNGDPNKGVLTINAGTFNPDTYTNSSVRLLGFGADVDEMFGYIKGGEFKGAIKINKYGNVQEVNSQVFYISGGIFSDDPTEFLATGYATEQDAEGKWIIRECPVKIGDAAYYATLAEAVAAAKEGETITILAGKTLEEGTIKLPTTLNNVTFAGEEGATLKNMTISAADGNSYNYEALTFNGITFDNSRILLTGWRNGDETIKNLTVTNCVFKNLDDTTNSAPVHINKEAAEAVNGFTFTNNVIDGATGGSKSGIYAQVTGEVLVSRNIINNVSFRPYVIQVTTDDNVADNFVVTNNTFSGSAVGRAQGLGNNAEGTDAVNIVISENIFKGITDAQQICYWNFNPAKTTADLSHNYYDIDILANPGKIYYNSAAANVYDLLDMGVFPIYTDEAKTTLYTPEVNSAKIGETEYPTLEEAVAAAKADDTITLLCNVTLSESLTLPAGIIFNGNGKQINGAINAGGNLTFAGHTKVTSFSASYYNRTITIGEGACLEVTGGGRVTLGYGNTFNITGSLENAKTADIANVQPSLIIPAGISITGGNDAAMNVTDAYVQIGSTTSKPGAANGEFTLNFTNSIVEFTKELGFYEPTGGMDPTFEMSITNSVFTTGAKLCVAAAKSTITVDNSNVLLGTYLRNSGKLNITNGSVLTGATIQFGENGGNNGAITVDKSMLTIKAGGAGHAFDGKNVGSITLKNGAEVNIDYVKDMILKVGDDCTFTYIKLDNCSEAVTNAEELTSAFKEGKNVILYEDIYSEASTTAPYGNKYGYKMDGGVLDGNGYELDIECYGDDYGIMTSGGTIKNLKIDNATRAIMVMYVNEDLTLDNVNIGGDGVLYPINTGEAGPAAETAKLTVSNSTLAGWTSYAFFASATFTNVEFKQGTYYNNIYGRVLKPYVNTTLTKCSFVEHMNLDLSDLANGHKVTMTNCTVNGQAVTAEVMTVPSSDAEYDTKLFTVDLPSWATSVNDCIIFN